LKSSAPGARCSSFWPHHRIPRRAAGTTLRTPTASAIHKGQGLPAALRGALGRNADTGEIVFTKTSEAIVADRLDHEAVTAMVTSTAASTFEDRIVSRA